ncbi:MAG: hypothetical protein ACYDEB_06335 [Dehalococcoidia bacterium]
MAEFPLHPPGTPQQWEFSDLSHKTQWRMADAALYTYENLCECTEAQLRGPGGFDDACIAEVTQRLAERGLHLAASAGAPEARAHARVRRHDRQRLRRRPAAEAPSAERDTMRALVRLEIRFLLELGDLGRDAEARLAEQYSVSQEDVARLVRAEMAKRGAQRAP